MIAYFTGARIDNCITLNRSMLSSDRTEVYLPTTKSNKPLTLYLSTVAQWVIEQALLVSDSEFVFPSTLGRTGHISHPASSFRRICARAGIACASSAHEINGEFPTDTLTVHCLRKTFATVILNNYAVVNSGQSLSSLDITSQLLGHANPRVTKRHYAFTDGKNHKLAVETAAQVMLKKIPNFPCLQNNFQH